MALQKFQILLLKRIVTMVILLVSNVIDHCV
jgi:hypothetical protein